jgi:ATP-dependent helicase/nuclease subunit B
VPTAQRASALRLAHARAQLALGRAVWATPDILTFDAWLARELARVSRDRGLRMPQLLNPAQQRELWRVALRSLPATDPGDSDDAARHVAGVARAAELAAAWRLPLPTRLAGADEFALLVSALREFRQLCADRGLQALSLADDVLLAQLSGPAPLFAGWTQLDSRQHELVRKLGAGEDEVRAPLPPAAAETVARPEADWIAEVRAAARWCRGGLAADPGARFLIVTVHPRVPVDAIEAQLREVLDPASLVAAATDPEDGLLAVEGGTPLATQEPARTALGLLALVADDALDFDDLSRLLRSPYLALDDGDGGTRLDLWLRRAGRARWVRADLVAWLAEAPGPCHDAATRLAAALRELDVVLDGRATLQEWARRVDALLGSFGHPGARPLDTREVQVVQRWLQLLEEFGSLDAVTSPVGAGEALRLLRDLARRSAHQAATGDVAVTLTSRLDDPLVHYDGIWVMGLSEGAWPPAGRPDPFLPPRVQQQAGIPSATAAGRLTEARRQLAQWRSRTTRLRLSYPLHDADVENRPTVLWPDTASGSPPSPGAGDSDEPMRFVFAAGASEVGDADEALPALSPGPGGLELRAGTRVPSLQRDCAFRAQAELRLGAGELDTPAPGIDARLRGRLLHRTLELLWGELGGSAGLHERDTASLADCIERAWRRASAEPPPRGVAPADARQLRREGRRTARVITDLLEVERARPAFTVLATEHRAPLHREGVRLDLRIDRIDRLDDGTLLIIDYKSGRGRALELLQERPAPVQLMAYLAAMDAPVGGLALLPLVPGDVAYRAVVGAPARLPSSRRVQVLDDWDALERRWRARIDGWLADFVAGDARVDPAPRACENCHLPGLCRIRAAAVDEEVDDDDEAGSDDGVPASGKGATAGELP